MAVPPPPPYPLQAARMPNLILLANMERLHAQLLACLGFPPSLQPLLQRTDSYNKVYMKWG